MALIKGIQNNNPFLVFTSEEAWRARGFKTSVHLEEFEKIEDKYKNDYILEKWKTIKDIRKVVTGALEKKRSEKLIGSSLESSIEIYVTSEVLELVKNIDFSEISITSKAELISSKSKGGFAIEEVKDIRNTEVITGDYAHVNTLDESYKVVSKENKKVKVLIKSDNE